MRYRSYRSPEVVVRIFCCGGSANDVVETDAMNRQTPIERLARILRPNRVPRSPAQETLSPLPRPRRPPPPSPPLPIDPDAACVVPGEPPAWLYQRFGSWLWSCYTWNAFDTLSPAQKIDHVMDAVSGLAPAQNVSHQNIQLGHRELTVREALSYALEIAIESKPSAVAPISRRLLQLHPDPDPHQPDTFLLFGVDFTRKRLAEWAHSVGLPGKGEPLMSRNSVIAKVEQYMYARGGNQNVHASVVERQMAMQLQRMAAVTPDRAVSDETALNEISACLAENSAAFRAFSEKFGSAGTLRNSHVMQTLMTVWKYIRSRTDQSLRRQLEASLVAKFAEIDSERPCCGGVMQRIIDVPTAIDWTLASRVSVDEIRQELQTLAAKICEEWDRTNDQLQHFVRSEIRERNVVGDPEQILNELKRDRFLLVADVEYRLLRGIDAKLVKVEAERVFPVGVIL